MAIKLLQRMAQVTDYLTRFGIKSQTDLDMIKDCLQMALDELEGGYDHD